MGKKYKTVDGMIAGMSTHGQLKRFFREMWRERRQLVARCEALQDTIAQLNSQLMQTEGWLNTAEEHSREFLNDLDKANTRIGVLEEECENRFHKIAELTKQLAATQAPQADDTQ